MKPSQPIAEGTYDSNLEEIKNENYNTNEDPIFEKAIINEEDEEQQLEASPTPQEPFEVEN